MDQRIFHGDLSPTDVAQALQAEFNHGNLKAQILGEADHLIVQIGTRPGASSGGHTALAVTLQNSTDGVLVQVGSLDWLGTAASLGWTAVESLTHPWYLLNRLDDIAQDVQNLQLTEKVWEVIDQAARAAGATHLLSQRLSRLACEYCGTANKLGDGNCRACGAPLGRSQPTTCRSCGFVVTSQETICPNCGAALAGPAKQGN